MSQGILQIIVHPKRCIFKQVSLVQSNSCTSQQKPEDVVMADRFVSAGTAEEPPERDEEWLAAQRELDEQAAARKKQTTSTAGPGLQEGGKTLYEVLQANKGSCPLCGPCNDKAGCPS